MEIDKYCNGDYYIICICEGTAEEDIMNWLLDEGRLKFSRENLVESKVTRIRNARKIQSEFLDLDYSKPVVIFRIVDSNKELFRLDKLYMNRAEIINFVTNPEIEMLAILSRNDYGKYKNREKYYTGPSDYAKQLYGLTKRKGQMKRFFSSDIESLIEAIKLHD